MLQKVQTATNPQFPVFQIFNWHYVGALQQKDLHFLNFGFLPISSAIMVAKGKTVDEPAKDSWSRAWTLPVISTAANSANKNFFITFSSMMRFSLDW